MKNKVGIVSCDKWKNIIKEDLMLQKELLEVGISSEIISWQDNKIDYSDYDCLILRSVWGYQNYYEQFKTWLLKLKEYNVKIYNDVEIILNNIRKDVQLEILDKYFIPHIPTTIIRKKEDLVQIDDYENDIVLKPLISGSGENTFLIKKDDKDIQQKNNIFSTCNLLLEQQENGIMIQPFISQIKDGEYACIFIDGVNTHNMLRYPGIFSEKKRPIYLNRIPKNVMELANKVAKIPEFNNYLYMRVDIVVENEKTYIMEVELAEPDLLMKYIESEQIKKSSIKTLAKKIERRIR